MKPKFWDVLLELTEATREWRDHVGEITNPRLRVRVETAIDAARIMLTRNPEPEPVNGELVEELVAVINECLLLVGDSNPTRKMVSDRARAALARAKGESAK